MLSKSVSYIANLHALLKRGARYPRSMKHFHRGASVLKEGGLKSTASRSL
jgi:hypothetical protein